ncbi:hypothetical protein V6N12_031855 [Hibiscus sabdariffa]|uniref:KAT8 regulatory NSL complex subunit 2 n=1 Tax=Hibiscus sabdariffa TaxID=183260 RepID=A0ABR2BYL5_9ROSI
MSSPLSQDVALARSTHLTREELLKRRLRHLRQLSRCYRAHYWALMENLKIQYRNYYWKFGISPFKQNASQDLADDAPVFECPPADNNVHVNNTNTNSNSNFGLNFKNNQQCSFVGCKLKAMALTRFCHLHILSDSKQKLYKACTYVIKSAHAGPITCGKPILRSTVPSLCTIHFQKTQKNVNRALKKANLNVSSSIKLLSRKNVLAEPFSTTTHVSNAKEIKGILSIYEVAEAELLLVNDSNNQCASANDLHACLLTPLDKDAGSGVSKL